MRPGLGDLLRAAAHERSAEVALALTGGPSLTYAGWLERVTAAAAGLRSLGVVARDRVAIAASTADWIEFAIAYFAVLEAGATNVLLPLDTSTPVARQLVRLAGAALLLTPEPDGPCRDWGAPRVADLAIATAGGGCERACGLERTEPAVIADLLVTSGTTSSPRLVAVLQEGVLDEYGRRPPRAAAAESLLHALPPCSMMAAHAVMLTSVACHRHMHVLPAFEPSAACRVIERERVTALALVPSQLAALLRSPSVAAADLSSLRRVNCSSAPLPPALGLRAAEVLPHAAIINRYGLTEAGSAHTTMRFDPARPRSVGRPAGGSEVRVVDEEGRAVPPGTVGSIHLQNRSEPRFYYLDSRGSAGIWREDGWVETGDVGWLDADGYLYVEDRGSDVVNVGGRKVTTLRIEEVLMEHPGVVEAAAVGMPHATLGEVVAAAVVVNGPASAAELRRFARERLAAHEAIRSIRLLPTLPRNAAGKVRKDRVRKLLARRCGTRSRGGWMEREVTRVLCRAIGVETMDPDEDFFAAGGDSLSALDVAAGLSGLAGEEFPIEHVFDFPTVRQLVDVVERAIARRRGAGAVEE